VNELSGTLFQLAMWRKMEQKAFFRQALLTGRHSAGSGEQVRRYLSEVCSTVAERTQLGAEPADRCLLENERAEFFALPPVTSKEGTVYVRG